MGTRREAFREIIDKYGNGKNNSLTAPDSNMSKQSDFISFSPEPESIEKPTSPHPKFQSVVNEIIHLAHERQKEREESVASDPKALQRLSQGRPKVEESEKLLHRSIRLNESHIEYIRENSQESGLGSKIRDILEQHESYQALFASQIRRLKNFIAAADKAIGLISSQGLGESNSQKIKSSCENLKAFVNILEFDVEKLKNSLTEDEFRTLNYAYRILSKYQKSNEQ